MSNLLDNVFEDTITVSNLEPATINGRKRILFVLRVLRDGAWLHAGRYSVPARTSRKALIAEARAIALAK